MLLAPIPWAARTWALPVLTALAPSERHFRERGQRHKKLTDWARRMMLQVRRWLPERELVLVTDMGFAALELLAALSHQGVTCITRCGWMLPSMSRLHHVVLEQTAVPAAKERACRTCLMC
jgi:DDE superfamily endonuclease